MATDRARARCHDRLDRMIDGRPDLATLQHEAIAELRRAIGFERWCWPLLDPVALVPINGAGSYPELLADLPRSAVQEARGDDVNSMAVLACSRYRVGVLSAATGGDLARSRRWREIHAQHGTGDELRAVTADEHGCWSALELFRDSDDSGFDAQDAQLMRDVSSVLARGLRRVAIRPAEGPYTAPTQSGVLLLGDDLRPRGSTSPAGAWLAAMRPAPNPFPGGIPPVVWSTVGSLLAEHPPRVRVRALDGSWAIIEAARVQGGEGGIAVTIHPAAVNDILALLCRAYGLTPRERELIALVVEGLDTRALAERLFISRHTVQDHLKSVFGKVGVNCRRELVTGIFASAA